jgi:hypothetical protein
MIYVFRAHLVSIRGLDRSWIMQAARVFHEMIPRGERETNVQYANHS